MFTSVFSHFKPLGLASLFILATSSAMAMGGRPAVQDDEAIASRIQPVGRVELAAAASPAAGNRGGEELVNAACLACHGTGAAGAPKIGDKAAWSPRLAQGLAGLVKSATAGKNAMPPKGGSDANELELTRAIVFMANKSGASFKEPAAK